MVATLHAEWIKYRRTATPYLLVFAPLLLVAFVSWHLWASHRLGSWPVLVGWLYQFWTMAWLPVGVALLAGLAATYEVQAGDWVGLRARPVRPARLYAAKLLVVCGHVLLSTLLLAGLAALSGRQAALPGDLPWCLLLVASLLSWLAALPLIAGQLWLATARGFAASLAVGSVGLLLAALIGGTGLGNNVWLLVLWAWPARSVGSALAAYEGEAVYLGQALLVGGLAAVLATLLAAAGCVWFARREVE